MNILEIEEYLALCVDNSILFRNNSSLVIPALRYLDLLNNDVTLSLLYMILYTSCKPFAKDFTFISRQVINSIKLCFEKVLVNRIQKLFEVKWSIVKASLDFLFSFEIITFQFKGHATSFDEWHHRLLADTRVEESNVLCGIVINDLKTFFENVFVSIASPLPYVVLLKNLCIAIKKSYGIDVTISDLLV